MPHPTNDPKVLLTIRFRHILTMVLESPKRFETQFWKPFSNGSFFVAAFQERIGAQHRVPLFHPLDVDRESVHDEG